MLANDDPTNEKLLLGLIAGCCSGTPRDEAMLGLLVEQLRLAQKRRGKTDPM